MINCYERLKSIFGGKMELHQLEGFIRMMDWMPNIVEVVFDRKEVVSINELGHLGE